VGPRLLDLAPDLTCHRCGYDLRGFTEHQSCPECNEPVWLSASRRVGELDRRRGAARRARYWLVLQGCLAAVLAAPGLACLFAQVTGKLSQYPGDVFGSARSGLGSMALMSVFILYCPPVAPFSVCCSAVLAVRAWGLRRALREHRGFVAAWIVSAAMVAGCIIAFPAFAWIVD
jgi:hypothetical protein